MSSVLWLRETSYRPGGGETICPPAAADGSSTRGGSASVRERVRSPHMGSTVCTWVNCRQPACLSLG